MSDRKTPGDRHKEWCEEVTESHDQHEKWCREAARLDAEDAAAGGAQPIDRDELRKRFRASVAARLMEDPS